MGRYGWRNSNGVTTLGRAVTTDVVVECRVCDYWSMPATMGAGRAAAHRHVAKTGHRVGISQTTIRQYGPEPGPDGR